MPSYERAIVFVVPSPVEIQYVPFHDIPNPATEKILTPNPIQVIPSYEYAIVFVPEPTATNNLPFHAILFPLSVKGPTIPFQIIPSNE